MNSRNYTILLLVLIILLGIILRLWPIQVAHWWDETSYLQNAEVIFSGSSNYDEFQIRPPLLSLLIAGMFIFYHNTFSAGILTALLGSLGIFFIYLLSKRIYDEDVALIAAAIYSFSPVLVESGHWIMTEAPALSLLIGGIYFFIKSDFRNNYNLFLSALFIGLAILMRFTSIIIAGIFVLYALMNNRTFKFIKERLLIWGVYILAVLAPYLIWVQVKYNFFLFTIIRANVVVSDYNEPFFFYFISLFTYFPPLLIAGLLLIIYKSFKKPKYSLIEKFLIVWFFIYLLYITLTPHKEVRYMLPLLPPLIILTSYELRNLLRNLFSSKNKQHRHINKRNVFFKQFGKYSLVVLILLISIYSFQASFVRINQPLINTHPTLEITIAEFIKSSNNTANLIYSNSEFPVLAYYTGLKVSPIYARNSDFYTFYENYMTEPGLFIYYKERSEEPPLEWLEENERFTFLKNIYTIYIYSYK